jgi:hypothetical protein
MLNTTIAINCGDHTNSLFEKKQFKARRIEGPTSVI